MLQHQQFIDGQDAGSMEQHLSSLTGNEVWGDDGEGAAVRRYGRWSVRQSEAIVVPVDSATIWHG